jgi:hypothetical protein
LPSRPRLYAREHLLEKEWPLRMQGMQQGEFAAALLR